MKSTKSEWRRALLTARAAIPADVRKTSSGAIVERARRLPCLSDARTVLGYVAMGAEVDALPLLSETATTSVFLPADSSTDTPGWVARNDGTLKASPGSTCFADPLVIVVPGVGYDLRGVRLGRGRGFYDRALADLRSVGEVTVVALAFECQVVAELPVDPWDEPVDWIVTERRTIDTAQGRWRREAIGR